MPPRDYESAPVTQALGLEQIVRDLAQDLTELRAGKITPGDAIARANLAKQLFNGVRLYLTASKFLAAQALPIEAACPQSASQDE